MYQPVAPWEWEASPSRYSHDVSDHCLDESALSSLEALELGPNDHLGIACVTGFRGDHQILVWPMRLAEPEH